LRVLAHEMAHIKAATLVMTITALPMHPVCSPTSCSSSAAIATIPQHRRRDPDDDPAPLAAMVMQLAISRSREYEADRIGAGIAASRLAARARQLGRASRRIGMTAERNPATAHLFIVNLRPRSTACSRPTPAREPHRAARDDGRRTRPGTRAGAAPWGDAGAARDRRRIADAGSATGGLGRRI
jgi:heat shock protein HtpX